jgi:predicted nucleotidyltransferase
MNEDIKAYISSRLEDLAQENGVRILHAVESGSRAWGFPSKDSDYDVRFIYAHDLDHYLSVDRKRDVIETPIEHDEFLGVDFDINGWDIKKVIYLAIRGNAVVNEWLTSPISYISDKKSYNEICSFVGDVADLSAYFHFYRNYMREPWNSYSRDMSEKIKIKHYCYVLRCALSLEWLEVCKTPPPMDVPSLLDGLDLDDGLRGEIGLLVSFKAQSVESDTVPRNVVLDGFIDNAVNEERVGPSKNAQEKQHIGQANALFKKIVMEA